MRALPWLSLLLCCVAACGDASVDLDLDPADAGGPLPVEDSGSGPDAGPPADAAQPEADAGNPGTDAGGGVDAGSNDAGAADAGPGTCPSGRTCVTAFPFSEERDSAASSLSAFDSYSCRATIDEGGPEIVYQVTVPSDGFLSASVWEQDGVDVDVHILGSLDPDDCLDRGNFHARADVSAGTWFVVVDTFVDSGTPRSGAFRVDIGFAVPSRGGCQMQTGEMPRVNDGGDHLAMPATGPMVLEAHLVTQEEPPPYPASSTEELLAHYDLSQGRTGFVLHRGEVWAPLEGGTFYGCGIGPAELFPVVDEGWYVNMYWTSAARPPRGTRMILRKPGTSRAVVVAAGYETGPGDLAKIGGTTEETLFYLLGERNLTLGLAVDQSLPLGPRVCE